jgi:FkbM family methyltransferase
MSKVVRIIFTTRNFYVIPLIYIGLVKEVNVNFIDGTLMHLSKTSWSSYWNKITTLYIFRKYRGIIKGNLLIFRFGDKEIIMKLPEIPEKIEELVKRVLYQFYFDQYKYLHTRNRIVVDIGAWIGDTTILFALKGASKILAIEPHPYSFHLLKINIELNKLSNVVKPINAAVSSKEGRVATMFEVRDTGTESLDEFSVDTSVDTSRIEVPIITLTDINKMILELSDYSNFKRKATLKIDCEGCEYEVILNSSSEDLKLYDEVILEFHHGRVSELIQRLKLLGFKTVIVTEYEPEIGILYAKKG